MSPPIIPYGYHLLPIRPRKNVKVLSLPELALSTSLSHPVLPCCNAASPASSGPCQDGFLFVCLFFAYKPFYPSASRIPFTLSNSCSLSDLSPFLKPLSKISPSFMSWTLSPHVLLLSKTYQGSDWAVVGVPS